MALGGAFSYLKGASSGLLRAAPSSVGSKALAKTAQQQLVQTASGAPISGGGGGGGGGGTTRVGSAGGTTVSGTGGTGGSYADIYSKILTRLEGGGASLEADIAGIEAGKAEAIARGEQNIISAGLSGTTVMAGVPIAAERGASLARLKARGEAESKYLTALSNFANLAFQAEESRLGREQSRLNLQAQLESSERRSSMGGTTIWPEAPVGGPGYMASRTPTAIPTTAKYSDQFPSLYGQGGQLPPAPDWTGGGVTSYTGSYSGTSLAAMSQSELEAFYSKYV